MITHNAILYRPNKPIRIRLKYLKRILSDGRLCHLQPDEYYFKLDIRHGSVIVAALRPSKHHSATLAKRQAEVSNQASTVSIESTINTFKLSLLKSS